MTAANLAAWTIARAKKSFTHSNYRMGGKTLEIGIGGHKPPSHTTGHAGPHPAVRLSMTKVVALQEVLEAKLSPEDSVQRLV